MKSTFILGNFPFKKLDLKLTLTFIIMLVEEYE